MVPHFIDYRSCCLNLELSSYCNLKCGFCSQFNNTLSDKGFLSFELFRKIIDEISGKGVTLKSLNPFFRGESLLHPDFVRMMDYIYDLSKKIPVCEYLVLHTNALLLDLEKPEAILKLCDQNRLIHPGNLFLSIDAASAITYSKVRGGDFNQLLLNISEFLEMRKKRKQWGPNVIFQFIVMEENYREAAEFYELCRNLCRLHSHKELAAVGSRGNQPFEVKGDIVYYRMKETDACGQRKMEELYLKTLDKLGIETLVILNDHSSSARPGNRSAR
ncbi:MAG: radical SAM protein [Candidatus Wallbacteria bacterium]|nr:radical SAM protein [Candidatus Wallbacteria bacterium]